MYLVLFSIVLYRTIVTVHTDNIFLNNYLQQMHQIIQLSPVRCFTPAQGKSMQKNREVSGVQRTADAMAPHLSVVFRQPVRLGSFPACWRQANVTPIPKGPPSSSVANYWPISITSVLSKVFECLVLVRLGRFWNAVVCYQPPSLLTEWAGYLWCSSVRLPYTAECIGEWAGDSDHADCHQCSIW